ncbi:MAG: ABC transporter ATP-binding protein [Bacteroidetes bacterium]|nr:ABC transporter ATP-binding protein [Bacteroidota bacterium]
MSDEILIDVENVSKKFCRNLKRSLWYGVKDIGRELIGRSCQSGDLREGEFWAVKDVSFQVRRGECLGLIGRNGAGKTTLLRMLNGLIKPDQGKITMRGRVGALIALGAGFNPVLTGRENIYAAGAVLGLTTREIDTKYNDIVEFAEMEEFMETPVQNYSSGMQMRLGFAVATALEPDILILDEVLAVGDASFRQKSLHRVSGLLSKAGVVFVSHNASDLLRICSQGIFLENGHVKSFDKIEKSLHHYNEAAQFETNKQVRIFRDGLFFKRNKKCSLNKKIYRFGEKLHLAFTYKAEQDFYECLLVLTFSKKGSYVLQSYEFVSFKKGIGNLLLEIGRVDLSSGSYGLSLTVMEDRGKKTVATWLGFDEIKVSGKDGYGISNQAPMSIEITNENF